MRISFADNYFRLFGIAPTFHINRETVVGKHRQLQSMLHPDRHVAAGAGQRRLAVRNAATVNEAYRVLSDDCARAAYLLELEGVFLNREAETTTDPDFLAEQMQLRGELEANERNPEALLRIEDSMQTKLRELGCEFSDAYESRKLDRARAAVQKMQFVRKLDQEVKSRLRTLEERAD